MMTGFYFEISPLGNSGKRTKLLVVCDNEDEASDLIRSYYPDSKFGFLVTEFDEMILPDEDEDDEDWMYGNDEDDTPPVMSGPVLFNIGNSIN